MNVSEMKTKLSETLSERRYLHSLGVADEAKKLAAVYGENEERSYLAGLLHDCAKELPPENMADILLDKYNVETDELARIMPKLLHGPLGACMAKDEYGVDDDGIYDAIWCHTTGKPDMTLLEKIIYIADYIEPLREFDGVDDLRRLAYENMDKAIILGIDMTISDLIERGLALYPETIDARNYLILNGRDE